MINRIYYIVEIMEERYLNAKTSRLLDQFACEVMQIPSLLLMENAGYGMAQAIQRDFHLKKNNTVLVLAGSGNNGGDAFVIARHLRLSGIRVHLFQISFGKELPKDAEVCREIWKKMDGEVQVFQEKNLPSLVLLAKRSKCIVDGIFGTGLSREIQGPIKSLIVEMERYRSKIASVDLPSGLSTDTGHALGVCVKAAQTYALGTKKWGHVVGDGPDVCGEVCVIPISVDPAWVLNSEAPIPVRIQPAHFQNSFPKMHATMHKGDRGHALIVAGSLEMSGASVLASEAALRVGAGLSTLMVPKSAHDVVKSQLLEVMSQTLPEKSAGVLKDSWKELVLAELEGKDSFLMGPGLSPSDSWGDFLRKYIEDFSVPTVLDAEALRSLSTLNWRNPQNRVLVLTPHPGEMAKLIGRSVQEVQRHRIEVAHAYAKEKNVFLVLKGAKTVVATPKGQVFVNETGNFRLASAGMGDVLAGMIAGFLARRMPTLEAILASVYIHGAAGDWFENESWSEGVLARDVLGVIPTLMMNYIPGKSSR